MNHEANPSLTCSTRDAARLLGVSVRTAQLWVEDGRLRAWKTPGGHRRILVESVERLLDEQLRSVSLIECPGTAVARDDPRQQARRPVPALRGEDRGKEPRAEARNRNHRFFRRFHASFHCHPPARGP